MAERFTTMFNPLADPCLGPCLVHPLDHPLAESNLCALCFPYLGRIFFCMDLNEFPSRRGKDIRISKVCCKPNIIGSNFLGVAGFSLLSIWIDKRAVLCVAKKCIIAAVFLHTCSYIVWAETEITFLCQIQFRFSRY